MASSRRIAGIPRSTPQAQRRSRRIARSMHGGRLMSTHERAMRSKLFGLIALIAAAGALMAPPPALAQAAVSMEAVIGNNFGHLPMFVGVDKGLFKKHGIDLKLKVVNTGTDMVNAMQRNE